MGGMEKSTVYLTSEQKAALARDAGADEVILYGQTDFELKVKEITGAKGVDVVYDSVGRTTFDKSLNCLAPRGTLALFGQSSGPIPPLDVARLAKNSLFLTRPSLAAYTATRTELLQRATDVFNWISGGRLSLLIHKTLPLKEAAEAHRLQAGRQTVGKVLLTPR